VTKGDGWNWLRIVSDGGVWYKQCKIFGFSYLSFCSEYRETWVQFLMSMLMKLNTLD
jgi:hypothetical protein